MQSQIYSLSGRSGNTWLLPPIAILAAALSAFVYAWIDVYSPVGGYVSVLFVLLLAGGAAVPLAYAGRLLKVRNVLMLRLIGVATGVATLYFAWAFFAWVLVARNDADAPDAWFWIQSPAALWELVKAINESGWFTISGGTPTGTGLWLLWAAEAAIVLAAVPIAATWQVRGRGFCEDCDDWMAPEEGVVVPAEKGAVASAVRKKGLPGITEVAAPSEGASRWLAISRQRCAHCKQAAVYSIDEVHAVQTKKGVETKATNLVPLSWATAEEDAEIARIGELMQAADAARFAALQAKKDAKTAGGQAEAATPEGESA